MEEYVINEFEKYTNVFKALSDITRLKIIWLLSSIDSKICVSEIIDVLGENQYNVSRHLKILKNAGLVFEKKEGKWVYYYYMPSQSDFDEMVKKAVLSISESLMKDETEKCKTLLDLRNK